MKNLARLALIAALSFSVIPAGAQTVDTLEPCGSSLTAVALGGLDESIATPALPGDNTTVSYVIDLAGEPVGTKARVDVAVTWDDPVSDFDIDVNGTSSAGFTLLDGVSEESVSLGSVNHCTTVTVSVDNFAGSPLAAMGVEIGAR